MGQSWRGGASVVPILLTVSGYGLSPEMSSVGPRRLVAMRIDPLLGRPVTI